MRANVPVMMKMWVRLRGLRVGYCDGRGAIGADGLEGSSVFGPEENRRTAAELFVVRRTRGVVLQFSRRTLYCDDYNARFNTLPLLKQV